MHGGQASQAQALVDHLAVQGRDGAPQTNERVPIVAEGVVYLAQDMIRRDLEGNVVEMPCEREGSLARRHGAVILAREPEIVGHVGVDPPQPSLIVDGLGKGFSLPKVLGDLLEISS